MFTLSLLASRSLVISSIAFSWRKSSAKQSYPITFVQMQWWGPLCPESRPKGEPQVCSTSERHWKGPPAGRHPLQWPLLLSMQAGALEQTLD